MAGVWFVVSIPTASFERRLKNPEEWKEKKEHLENRNGKSQVINHDKDRPNGQVRVDIHKNEKNLNRSVNNGSKDSLKVPHKHDGDSEEKSLEWHLRDCLDKLAIYDAVWILSREDTFHQVFFPCEGPGMECDFVLQSIQNRGIGVKWLSTVGIMPCDVFYRDYGEEDEVLQEDEIKYNEEQSSHEKKAKGFKAMQKEFLKSVTARLTVAQVVERVRNDGTLSFDFLMFVFIASCIAALGLSESSSVIIVAAMLISPIMGPIMGVTFGLMIRDRRLIRTALRTEVIGLSICLVSGFIYGFVCGNFSETWSALKWPTPEMQARGMGRSLWSGCLIALPSGAGVAMSILQGNGASLVGVAISASLLPPTVNCGLLWGLAAIKRVRSWHEDPHVVTLGNLEKGFYNLTLTHSLMLPEGYQPTYFGTLDKECAALGIISFLLTIVNILCIIISALIILKVKEVAPNTTEPAVARFWKHDVKVARDYNKTLGETEGEDLGKQFLEEWANLNGIDPNTMKNDSEESRMTQLQTLIDIVEDAEEDDVFRTIAMSVPAPAAEQVNRRLSIVPGMGLQESAAVGSGLRRHSQGAFAQLKKRRQSKMPSFMEAGIQHEDAVAEHVRNLQIPRKSVIYNQPLQNPENPYSMWPTKNRIQQELSRFNVSPVIAEGQVLPSVRGGGPRTRRRSCFTAGQQPGSNRPSLQKADSTEEKDESTAF